MTRPSLVSLLVSATLWLCSACALAETPRPGVAANAWLLMDAASGQILDGAKLDERVEPASLTKLMTAYLVFAALREKRLALEQPVRVSEKAWHAGGARMFIDPRKPVTVGELIQGMVVQSGNDACIALAEAVAGSEEAFVSQMNAQAKRLGLGGTRFTNASGLPDAGHYSTARDLAMLAAALIREFPEEYRYYSMKEYRYNDITQPNRNRLLWLDPNVDGVKTGYTQAAGYCLIASARRGPRRMLAVVMGAASGSARVQESQRLLNHGFLNYEAVRLYEKGQGIKALPVWKGGDNTVPVGFGSDFYVTVPRGAGERVSAELVSRQPLLAPIAPGQIIGTLKVTLDGKPLREHPVVALKAVGVAGFFGRAWDTMRLWFN